MIGKHIWDRLEELLGDEDARTCKDIPEEACREQPHNFATIFLGNCCNKIADEFSSARVVLPWFFSLLGAPAVLVSYLVPLREAGVLVPQLAVAAALRLMPKRKYAWAGGALLCAASLAGIVALLSTTEPNWLLIFAALTAYSLGRGICSVAAKDVMGKSISKSRRGQLMGMAGSVAGAAGLVLALLLLFLGGDSAQLAFALLGLAALLWVLAAACFLLVAETDGSTGGGENGLKLALESLHLLKSDPGFRRFVWVRSGLTSIAMVPPFYVLLLFGEQDSLQLLAQLLLATGLAAFVSSPFWGRFSDRSSRKVMGMAAWLAAACNLFFLLGLWLLPASFQAAWGALLFFLLSVAHAGVRLGRKTWLVDYGTEKNRASLTAVSNSIIGLVLLLGGAFGWLAQTASLELVIVCFTLVTLVAALATKALPEVSDPSA